MNGIEIDKAPYYWQRFLMCGNVITLCRIEGSTSIVQCNLFRECIFKRAVPMATSDAFVYT